MAKPEDDLVQRYFDDELGPEERARFEAAMSDDDRERLAALGEMRVLLNTALDADAGNVDIWAGVDKQLGKQRAHRSWMRRRAFGGAASIFVAAAAALLLLMRPFARPENDCDVESMEVDGAYATVMQIHDVPHEGDHPTTVIWAEED